MSSTVLVMIQKGPKIWTPLVWKRILVRKSLDEICHYLELEIPVSERSKIHKHDRLSVLFENPYIKDSVPNIPHSYGKRLVTTVLVDELSDTTDTASKFITVVGRSPARDIIDSTWSGRESGTLFNVIKRIAGKFDDIPVAQFPDDGIDHTENITSFSFENESPWTKMMNEASNQGYIFTSSEIGGLYL